MKLNELLKIKYPIIQGGMANIATGEFAASVSNAGGLGLIGAGGMNAKMLKEAPMAIVVCGDTTKSSYWYLDCSAVTQNILLAAEAIGLGAVWTATYPYADRMEIVKKYTGIPEQINSLCVIPVGYPAMPHSPKDKWDASKVHMNKW